MFLKERQCAGGLLQTGKIIRLSIYILNLYIYYDKDRIHFSMYFLKRGKVPVPWMARCYNKGGVDLVMLNALHITFRLYMTVCGCV